MATHSTIKELERMTPSELRLELQRKREEAAKMRLGLTMQNEKNSAGYRILRKEIAQACFVLGKMNSAKKVNEDETKGQETKPRSKKKTKSPSQIEKKSVQHSSSSVEK